MIRLFLRWTPLSNARKTMAYGATAVKIVTLFDNAASTVKPLKSMLMPASLGSLRERAASVRMSSVLSTFPP